MSLIDVNEARKRLVDALGDSSKEYFAYLKAWFCMKFDRDEFDRSVRQLLPMDQVYLHNEFFFAIVTKCQSLCEPNSKIYQTTKKQHPLRAVKSQSNDSPDRLNSNGNILKKRAATGEIKPVIVSRPVKPKTKPSKVNFDNRFQPVDPTTFIITGSPSLLDSKAQQPRYCRRDNTLPDIGLIHGQMLVAAWDAGLERGCEDKAISLVLTATEQFLKKLLVAIITDRKGYRLRENQSIHSIGQPTLNPWLHNSWSVHDQTTNSYATDICPSTRSHIPAIFTHEAKAERDSAYYLACTTEQVTPLKPISVLDVFQTLQVKKNVIPWHSIIAPNMERISLKLYHPDS